MTRDPLHTLANSPHLQAALEAGELTPEAADAIYLAFLMDDAERRDSERRTEARRCKDA